MNISEVKVKLTADDIMSIINEFVKVEGLDIQSIAIEDGITLKGSFKKLVTLKFEVKAEVLKCDNNKIYVKLAKVKMLNLKIIRIFRSFILKQLSKICSEYGITNEKEVAVISVDKALKDVPYVNLKVNDVYTLKNEIFAEVNNIEVSIAGNLIKKVEAEKVEEDNENEEKIDLDSISKVNDNYSKGREKIKNKLSESTRQYSDYIFILPDIMSLIYRLLKDKRVSFKSKMVIISCITYIAVPKDFIPDSVPFIGKIDDTGVIFFTLNRIVNDIPLNVILENYDGKNEILLVLKNGLEYLINFTKADNVEKLYGVILELSKL